MSINPLLEEFKTPYGVPPFNSIKDEHYLPAFEKAFSIHEDEIKGIIENTAKADFENTIAAMDYSGELLKRISYIFYSQNSANTNEKIQEIAKEVIPRASAHYDKILMNPSLFTRVKSVYENRENLSLNHEQLRLLENVYKDFVRGGALLNEVEKARLTEINQRCSLLEVQFGENILAENNDFKMVLEKDDELSGLPESVREAAFTAGEEAGLKGKALFTLHNPSWIPFLQFSERRDLREKLLTGYMEKGNHNDKNDNKEIASELVKLRIERSGLLGFETHADYILDENMAKTPAQVNKFLDRLWNAALPVAQSEAKELQSLIKKEGKEFNLEPWDWWLYTEKLRKEKFNLSDEELRPYFQLENVQKGAFEIATKLFGLKFTERDDVPVYHKDVKVVEIFEKDGNELGLLYLDYHPRASKKQGAWMTVFRKQEIRNGDFVRPVVVNVFNFSRPSGDKPALLSLDEVTTLFHEFGHALHGLLSNVAYPGLSGTSVARDFVELPSQFMENWAVEPSVLKSYAKHYKSGEPIPDELIDKIIKARHFNQGFETTEYLAASFLDMRWHTLKEMPGEIDVVAFEKKVLDEIKLIPEILSRYRSTYFAHIFAGGYSAGYYSYIWSAVLDADAFFAFKEKENLFDEETAKKFRDEILSKGNTAEPMELYKKFRGREPEIDPLLERRGLNN